MKSIIFLEKTEFLDIFLDLYEKELMEYEGDALVQVDPEVFINIRDPVLDLRFHEKAAHPIYDEA